MKKPKVYIAAPWVHKTLAAEAQQKFEDAGFEVVSRWIKFHNHEANGMPYDDQMIKAPELMQEQALEDLKDLNDADAFVILNSEKSEGKAFEFGYFRALYDIFVGIPRPHVVVGPYSRNIFYRLPDVVRVDTVEQAIEHLNCVLATSERRRCA